MYEMGWQELGGAGVGDLGHDFQELEDRLRGSEELEGLETSFTTPKNLKISVAVIRILEISRSCHSSQVLEAQLEVRRVFILRGSE